MSKIPDNPSFGPGSTTPRELSDNVSRIASNLAQLATQSDEGVAAADLQAANIHSEYILPIDTVRDLIHARRLRAQFFDEKLFADPAWDMLLELFHAEISDRRVSVTSLCVAAGVPSTTVLRWIKVMTDAGLFRYPAEPRATRGDYVELSPMASKAMHSYFNALGRPQSAPFERGSNLP